MTIERNGGPGKPGAYCYRCEDLGIAGSEWQWEKPLSNWICSNFSQHDHTHLPGNRGLTSVLGASDPSETYQVEKTKKTRLDLYRIPPKEDARPWLLYYLDPAHQVLITPDRSRQELDTTAIVPLLEQVAREPKQRILVVGGDDATNSLKRE